MSNKFQRWPFSFFSSFTSQNTQFILFGDKIICKQMVTPKFTKVCVIPVFLFSYLVAKYSHHQLSSLVVEHI